MGNRHRIPGIHFLEKQLHHSTVRSVRETMQRRAITWTWILVCLLFVGFSDTAAAQGTTITVTPSGPSSPLTFNVPAGNVTSAAQTVSVTSTVATTITVQVSAAAQWLQVDPTIANVSNTAATHLNVRVNPNGLAQGSYQGTFTVAQAQNVVATVFVNMNVSGQSQLSASPSSLTFTANQGASVGTPASTPVTISSTGPQLSYTLTSSTQTGRAGYYSIPPAARPAVPRSRSA
jgi:hypothetical protein